MVIVYSFETPSIDAYFLALDCQTSKGSAQGCIQATRECTWGIPNSQQEVVDNVYIVGNKVWEMICVQ